LVKTHAKAASESLASLSLDIIHCRRCPRLVAWREAVGRKKRAAFRDQVYWARPVPGFGDPNGRLAVVGLAPAAHGGNRTGRVFTGDPSAQFLFGGLHRAGFANQPTSLHRDDGLALKNAYIFAAVRCAPPDNRPTPEEFARCAPFLAREFRLLTRLRVVLALGAQAYAAVIRFAQAEWGVALKPPKFAHSARFKPGRGRPLIVASYHPSPRNTQTGKFTAAMSDWLLADVKRELDGDGATGGN